eukprot:2237675-Rhodomonas_salina.2
MRSDALFCPSRLDRTLALLALLAWSLHAAAVCAFLPFPWRPRTPDHGPRRSQWWGAASRLRNAL